MAGAMWTKPVAGATRHMAGAMAYRCGDCHKHGQRHVLLCGPHVPGTCQVHVGLACSSNFFWASLPSDPMSFFIHFDINFVTFFYFEKFRKYL
ncbi:unnamed protein product [Trifolium pratense]|uniref:Uncharacterized protein n=1 Tax=Trifolium pratense TaxID=57577 RepID=A0ACB0K636_TRIPR|nr:unnamed protein product [Trifolium pratense]